MQRLVASDDGATFTIGQNVSASVFNLPFMRIFNNSQAMEAGTNLSSVDWANLIADPSEPLFPTKPVIGPDKFLHPGVTETPRQPFRIPCVDMSLLRIELDPVGPVELEVPDFGSRPFSLSRLLRLSMTDRPETGVEEITLWSESFDLENNLTMNVEQAAIPSADARGENPNVFQITVGEAQSTISAPYIVPGMFLRVGSGLNVDAGLKETEPLVDGNRVVVPVYMYTENDAGEIRMLGIRMLDLEYDAEAAEIVQRAAVDIPAGDYEMEIQADGSVRLESLTGDVFEIRDGKVVVPGTAPMSNAQQEEAA